MALQTQANLKNTTAREILVAAGDGAQANLAISPAVATSQRLIVHEIYCTTDGDNSVSVLVRVGFAAATLPAAALAGADGIILSHVDLAAGSGMHGFPGIGAAGEELRLTCDAPTGGNLTVSFLYELVTA